MDYIKIHWFLNLMCKERYLAHKEFYCIAKNKPNALSGFVNPEPF